jgi:hypothetical protein
LATSNQNFGECLVGLASLEMNPELAQTFIDFGTVHKRIHDLQTKQVSAFTPQNILILFINYKY